MRIAKPLVVGLIAVIAAVPGVPAAASAADNGHNCEGVISAQWKNPFGVGLSYIAHRQLEAGNIPADGALGGAWSGGVDDGITQHANCGVNR